MDCTKTWFRQGQGLAPAAELPYYPLVDEISDLAQQTVPLVPLTRSDTVFAEDLPVPCTSDGQGVG